jgi:hypothetical protein
MKAFLAAIERSEETFQSEYSFSGYPSLIRKFGTKHPLRNFFTK